MNNGSDAPDPMQTALAQQKMNKDTAITQAGLNNVNQVTPEGSLTYDQSTWANGDPRYTATTALSPENQAIFDINKGTQTNIANIGRDQSGRIGDLLGTPMKLGNDATEARLMDLGMRRLNPQFAKDEEAIRTRLANTGIKEGSAAWNSELGRFGESKNDAITQLLLSGRGIANQELLTERNQPINEITALMSGSQVQPPNFVNTPQTQVGGVNYTGLVADKYKADQAASGAAMGGMFGLGGSIGGAALENGLGALMFSDRRMKEDIKKVGELDNDLPVYSFKYKGDSKTQIGVMAQDVDKKKPEAVHDIGGLLAVDYAEAVRA